MAPRILFLMPDVVNPSGGVWVVYRHVEILNRHGIESVVVHQERDFRYPWDTGTAPVTTVEEIHACEGDLLVLPDVAAGSIRDIDLARPVAVFSQNAYLTPWEAPTHRGRPDNPYRAPNLVGVITTNRDNQRRLARAFPHLDVRRIYLTVSETMTCDVARKEPLVSYMPRKNPDDAARVVGRLQERGAFDGIEVVAIRNRTHDATAEILARSTLFLSFGHPEGWALPPAEAMASGCVIVGYHGMGGEEYWAPGCTHPVPFGDVDTYVTTVEGLLDQLRVDVAPLHAAGRRAAAFIRASYPPEQEVRSVVDAWSWLLSRAATRVAEGPVSAPVGRSV